MYCPQNYLKTCICNKEGNENKPECTSYRSKLNSG